jgi:hypothetical protein
MATKAKDVKPLPLGNTLRDLALLRASEVEVSVLLPTPTTPVKDEGTSFDAAVEESYEFVREARKAMKIEMAGQGERVEAVRNKLEELLSG